MGFLLKIITDSAITLNITEKIFIELLESFPKEYNKRDFGELLLTNCIATIERRKSDFTIFTNTQLINNKINKLLQVTRTYGSIVEL
jgi:hypothetical protein